MVAVHVMPRFVNFGLQTSEIHPHLYCSKKVRCCNLFISIRNMAALLVLLLCPLLGAQTATDMARVTIEGEQKTAPKLSNGTNFNDFE